MKIPSCFLNRSLGFALSLALTAPASFGALVHSLTEVGCTTGCTVIPAGTVTLAQNGLDTVRVSVELVDDYSFRDANDANHHSFVFNLAGNPAILIANLVASDTVSQTFVSSGPGSYTNSPHGTFGYFLECDGCVTGIPVDPTRSLVFDVVAAGLTEASFVANASGYFFSVDVVGITAAAGLGETGNIGSKGADLPNDPTVPEPGSLLMLTTGLGAVSMLAARRRKQA